MYENIAASCGDEWPAGMLYQNVLAVTPQQPPEENLYEDVQVIVSLILYRCFNGKTTPVYNKTHFDVCELVK